MRIGRMLIRLPPLTMRNRSSLLSFATVPMLRGQRMSDRSRSTKRLLHLTPLLGIGLLVYLIATANLRVVAAHAATIGWGMLLVIALGGLTHVFKTWAWRLTLRDEARKI